MNRVFRKRYKRLFSFIVLYNLFSIFLFAQLTFQLSDKDQPHQAQNFLEIAEVSSAFLQPNSNKPFRLIKDWDSIDSNKSYWGKLRVRNTSSEKEWIIEFSQIFTEIELFHNVDDSLFFIGKTGTFLPPNQRTYAISLKPNLFQLSIPTKGTHTYFFKAYSERINNPLNFSIQFSKEEQYSKTLGQNKLRNSFYIGITFMLLIFSLILFAFGKDWSYIYYAIYLLGIIIFTCYNSGDLADFLNASLLHDTPQYIYLFKLVIYTSIVGYISFIRRFLNLSEVLPKWNFWFRILSIIALPLGIIELILLCHSNFSFNYDVLNIYYTVAFAVTNCLFIIPLFRLKADTKALFILLGTVIMGIGLIITAYLRLQSVDFTFSYFKIGSVFEFILFFLGLAYSQQVAIKEKEQAAFALEKNQLIQLQQQQEVKRQQELNDFKTRFYDNITHEFKTPITVIKGLAQLDKWTDKDRRIIVSNANQLDIFVNQLLELSKLEAKELIVQLHQIDILPLITSWITIHTPLAVNKEQQLSLQTDLVSLYMDTDVQVLEKIIGNLLSNAIKFTPIKGSITLKLECINEELLIHVQDTGPGIPSEQLEYIFDRHYQVNTHYIRHGSGLGLSIAKECAELLHGNLTVNSNNKSGSIFSLQLPIQRIHPIVHLIEEEKIIEETISAPFHSARQALENEIDKKPVLLIIEDNKNLVYYMERFFENQFRFEKTFDGITGLAKAKDIIPDIIICDVMMPKMDGFQVCALLKSDPSTSHIPIIMVTAKSSRKDKIEGFRSGVDAFLTKPYDEEELMIHIERLQKRQLTMRLWMKQLTNSKKEESITFPQESVFQQENIFLQEVNTYLEAHIKNPKTKQQLADLFFIGERQFARKLKSITGFSPSKYIRFFKVFKARKLLAKKEMLINEIAYDVGFENVAVFNRAFKEFYNKTPKEIRQF